MPEIKVMTEMPRIHIQENYQKPPERNRLSRKKWKKAKQRRKKMRITKTSNVLIFVLAVHRAVATSYFVHVFR